MRLEIIYKYLNGYYLKLGDIECDDEIAELLDLSKSDFIEILERHHAHNITDFYMCYYFENKEDIEKAIEELDPHVVMATLIGEMRNDNREKTS